MDLPLASFAIVTLTLMGAMFLAPLVLRRDRSKVTKRLNEEFCKTKPEGSQAELFHDLDAMKLAPLEEYALLNDGKTSRPKVQRPGFRKRLDNDLNLVRIPLNSSQFLGFAVVLAVGLGLIAGWLLSWHGGVMVFAAGAIAPFLFLNFKRKSRRERFLKQLPSAFELMARVIRSGQSVPQALQAVAEAFEEPLSGEFANCEQQQNLGLRPEVVFQEMANRSDIIELRIFSMAMMIQRQTGGNLSEVLDRLALLIRNRLRLRQQIRTLTAEGRLQGLTLLILPVVMFIAMYFLNRNYALVLLDHPSLLAATAACMGVGVLWIRSIVNFEG